MNGDDIVQGCVKYLQAFPDVVAVVGSFAVVPASPYLFQHRLWVEMEGSQSTAAVISSDTGWAAPNLHNTLRFPRVVLTLYADPARDSQGNVTDPGEVRRRIDDAFTVFDRRLHRVSGGTQMWGTVRTVSCERLTEPTNAAVPDGDGLRSLVASYAVTQG